MLDRAASPSARPPAELRRRARDRARAYRRRIKGCRVMVPVEVGPEALDLLLRTGWLLEVDVCDRRKVGEAIACMLADAAKRR
jgi:hypothetical protein